MSQPLLANRQEIGKISSPGDGASLTSLTTILPSLDAFKEFIVSGNRSMI